MVRQRRGTPKQPPHIIKKVFVTEKRLQRDSNLCERYKGTIMNCIRNGYARKLAMEEVQKRSRKTWFLPPQQVCSEHKPEKV